ncbi:prepilin-type N-terminal cleavage/methylation domain-containing protein [Candidatus Peregrinibacteria bacterium]|jgi:type II secretion system protein G|nr:prepilin-type N-terminal cleavage/methylation domain-containing protein [Candidatus Peregrinibacteria bacterium]
MKLKNKGFTLIELMVVVVILGVLMSTVFPKLVGAQARSRDTGRMADMRNISAALGVYFDDTGKFPGINNTSECLDETVSNSVGSIIAGYLEGAKAPRDIQVNANEWLCKGTALRGKYWYMPISKNGIERNAYIICTDVESFQKANTDLGDFTAESDAVDAASFIASLDKTYAGLNSIVGAKIELNRYVTEDTDRATQSGLCMIKP